MKVVGGPAAMLAASRQAAAADTLDPADPYAKSMGFRLSMEEVNQANCSRHTNDQKCQSCKLWNGGDKASGNCSFHDGAVKPKNGWCKRFKLKLAA